MKRICMGKKYTKSNMQIKKKKMEEHEGLRYYANIICFNKKYAQRTKYCIKFITTVQCFHICWLIGIFSMSSQTPFFSITFIGDTEQRPSISVN